MALKITNDFIFRFIFSQPENSDLLLDLVNTVLIDSGDKPLARLEAVDSTELSGSPWDKDSCLDLKARSADGTYINVEVQLWDHPAYPERSLFYWARIFSKRIRRGAPYTTLYPVICVNLLGFNLFPSAIRGHSCFRLREDKNPQIVLTDRLVLHFIEMEKTSTARLSQWLQVFHILQEEHSMTWEEEAILNQPEFAKLKVAFEKCLQDPVARERAFLREKFEMDQLSLQAWAREQMSTGLQKGMEQGLKQGIEQGRNEGRQAAKEETLLQVARSMKAEGMDDAAILHVTGLSPEHWA